MKNNLRLIKTIQSVLWALLGVQSENNRAQDFNHGNPVTFIVVGLIAVVVFILSLVLIVNLVLN
ncbi:DUF2970 domain-containing protein [Thalassotalea sp. LPB0316]|uniref:DUF2970 domain-containing protein n=1 Tax=Thalassotalea sp. LPB0316 TaxID=2769490 RepID=UPI00186721D7|nr:DUF2970 domain-containing protein [Thalassotalea sp. LPB0316]QOL26565.1 DUF2970 domain-containing protein [Thalassotalea sp. LPB0316]